MGIFDALRHENHLVDSLDEAVAHARSHAAASGSAQASSIRLA
jgi:SulP family sulfate permease